MEIANKNTPPKMVHSAEVVIQVVTWDNGLRRVFMPNNGGMAPFEILGALEEVKIDLEVQIRKMHEGEREAMRKMQEQQPKGGIIKN